MALFSIKYGSPHFLHANPELGRLGRDELGCGERDKHVPLGGVDGAELLAEGARTAAHGADAVTNDITAGTSLLAEVVTHDAASARNEAHHQTMLDNGTLLANGRGVELAGAAGAAAPPAPNAHESALKIGSTTAWRELPALVESAGLTSPVNLVEAEDTLNATRLDLIDTAWHEERENNNLCFE